MTNSNLGAKALKAWLDAYGKPGFDALWQACGWGLITVDGIVGGEIQPDPDLAAELAEVTQGAVTIAMFGVPATLERAA